eukprot:gene161-2955_t
MRPLYDNEREVVAQTTAFDQALRESLSAIPAFNREWGPRVTRKAYKPDGPDGRCDVKVLWSHCGGGIPPAAAEKVEAGSGAKAARGKEEP